MRVNLLENEGKIDYVDMEKIKKMGRMGLEGFCVVIRKIEMKKKVILKIILRIEGELKE